jgi:uncharacterized protein
MARETHVENRTVLPGLIRSIVVLAVLLGALYIRDLAKFAGMPIPALPMAYGGSTMDNLLAVAAAVLALFALKPKACSASVVSLLGLGNPGWLAPVLVLLSTIPFWLACALLGTFRQPVDVRELLFTALLFPIAEELLFRGFGFVFVRLGLAWRFWLALVLQAVCFGCIHWFGLIGSDAATQVLLITSLGGLLFAALDALNGYTIWCGLVFHCSLNASWDVFEMGPSAATGWQGNIWRIASALLALLLVWLVQRKARSSATAKAGAAVWLR